MLIKSLIKALKKMVALSRNTIILSTVLLVVFILSGGIYIIFTNPFPPSAITVGQKAVFVIPSSLTTVLGIEQTSSETMAVMFFIVLGVLGILLIDKSVTFVYDSKTAQIWIVVGIILVSISILGLMFLNNVKTAGIY
ncbi:MAG: hypothetical protein QXP91_10120 [Candidatus Methanomethylicia archaeon]